MSGKEENPTLKTKLSLTGKVDPSQEQEVASPPTVETLDSDAVLAPSLIAELNETLNIARAFNATRKDASNSG